MNSYAPAQRELSTPNLDLRVIATHGPELDVRMVLLILKHRLRGLLEVLEHRFDVLVIAVCGVLEEFYGDDEG